MTEPSYSNKNPNKPPAELSTDEKLEPQADPWDTDDKRLNYFVGAVALMERLGNGLGMLAFTWATVVVLGGFSTDLGKDFWYATAIVFLEGFRVFSRESGRSDDELLFKTTGSISLKRLKLSSSIPYYLTVSIVIISMYGTLDFSLCHFFYKTQLQYHILLLASLLALASVAQAPTAAEYLKDNSWLQFLSALVAVLALGSAMLWSHIPKHEILLIIPPLLIGCLQSVFTGIGGLLRQSLGWEGFLPILGQAWLRTLVSLILPAWVVISVLLEFNTMGVLILLGTVLLANIQIPVAVARIVLSTVRLYTIVVLAHGKYDKTLYSIVLALGKDDDEPNKHLLPALIIFYSMVLAQGVLYLAACVLESLLSSHYRRSLARSCNLFNSKQGYASINVYYEYAYNRRMQEGVLAQEDMNLANFVLNSLDSNSDDKKLAAVQILDSLLLLQGNSYAKLVSKITTSTKVVATLISMLGRTAFSDDDYKGISIRYFTAKVVASLAGDLRIVAIPGTVQMISSLLDHIDDKNKKAKQDISNQISDKNELGSNGNQQRSHASYTAVNIQEEHGSHARTDGQQLSKQVEGGNKAHRKNVKSRFFNWINIMIKDLPEGNEPSKDIDWFPMQGMLILEKLAHDLDNCGEINKAIGLIPKITGFIINSTDTTKNIMTPSLKLIAKLINIEGDLGDTFRENIFGQPFFFSNLVEILVDDDSHTTQWKPMMVIIAKIILKDTSKNIEKLRVIIPKLVHAFLGPDESSDKSFDHRTLRTMAGEALSNLVEKNDVLFCRTIFQEKGYGLIGDLKNIVQQDEYTYMAARLLMNLCKHWQEELQCQRPSELLSMLRVVLDKILYAENKQLEALIVNATQLYSFIPSQQIGCELESRTNKEQFVQKLVDALNSNKKICDQFPRMRRVIVEITIYIVKSCPQYSPIFKSNGMIEALSKVEKIIEKMEKYKDFFGDPTTKELASALPPSDLVTTAKQLIGSETPNQEANNVHLSSSVDIVHVMN